MQYRRVGPAWFGVLAVATAGLLGACPVRAQTHPALPAASQGAKAPLQIPAGTILSVRLDDTIAAKSAQVSQVISGHIMQDVPLSKSAKIPKRAKVMGKIVGVIRPGGGEGGSVSLRFDQIEIHHQRIALVTNLWALASVAEVREAQIPETGPDRGTPQEWATTRQVGGDEVYGVGGPVTDRNSERVGKGVYDGVLVHVRAQPESPCRGGSGEDDRLQALWVFSSDACGVYGLAGVSIAHAGRTDPKGEIQLKAEHGELKVSAGTGMLLRVIG